MIRDARRVVGATAAVALALAYGPAAASGPALVGPPAPGAAPEAATARELGYRGGPGFVYGGQAEIRFAHDRLAGVGDPDWLSVVRVGGGLVVALGDRVRIGGSAAFDEATDKLVVEQAFVSARVGARLVTHAGVLPAPLGVGNAPRLAPRAPFTERSIVSAELVGAPLAQLGAGVRAPGRALGHAMEYEVDLLSGYGEGMVTDAPEGTRLSRGRTPWRGDPGSVALAGRLALRLDTETTAGLAMESGVYRTAPLAGANGRRWVHLLVGEARGRLAGLQLGLESAAAAIDVAPGLEGLFAERQWGASVEIARPLWAPLIRSWKGSSLALATRAEAVDFDLDVPGDSKRRVAASLNVHPADGSVIRFGWYYGVRRDRFDNDEGSAGLTLSLATLL